MSIVNVRYWPNVTRRFRSIADIFAALKQTAIQLSSSLAGHSRSQGQVSWTTKLGAAFTPYP